MNFSEIWSMWKLVLRKGWNFEFRQGNSFLLTKTIKKSIGFSISLACHCFRKNCWLQLLSRLNKDGCFCLKLFKTKHCFKNSCSRTFNKAEYSEEYSKILPKTPKTGPYFGNKAGCTLLTLLQWTLPPAFSFEFYEQIFFRISHSFNS